MRRACGRAATGQCVYCGELFCGTHGDHGSDYYEVCRRKSCVAKYDDVHAHQRWILDHRGSNDLSMCAADECRERMQHACERCRLKFCEAHLGEHMVPTSVIGGDKELAMLCMHCIARRVIWD